jgi:uncharacterized protein (TIGR03790 family)
MRFFLTLALILVPGARLFAQSAQNILLILNETSPVSLDVGQYYAEKRGIPPDNILRLRAPADESIDRALYSRLIEGPIAGWLTRDFAQDRILYLVLTKGVPLRISGTYGQEGTVASVDSELTLLYRKLAGQAVPPAGRVANPYFQANAENVQPVMFTHESLDIYLVTRLDGYTFDDVRGLIDRGMAPSREGKIVLDGKASSQDKGETWLQAAADSLRAAGYGDRVLLDMSSRALTGIDGVLGYYSWGSNDPSIRQRRLNLTFVPGALAAMFVSSDARTFTEPPADWNVGAWDNKAAHFAGSPQSLTGDLIREGVTGVAGHVAEPFLEAAIRPNILFPAYLSGFNLAESFYLAMPFLSWQTVVVGDPLCAPFRTRYLNAAEIDPGIDEATELPKHFSNRRLRTISVVAYQNIRIHPDTIRLLLHAEVRLMKQDKPGAQKLLEEAITRDSRLALAQIMLANIYEQDGEYDKAIERYRRVLQLFPNSPTALNNLAYALAVRKGQPAEALPLAEKAYGVARGSPNVADTLGWILHLSGDDARAIAPVEEAMNAAPQNPEIQVHAAVIYAALGKTALASEALGRALKLDPALASRDDVKLLQSKLGQMP